VFGRLTVGRRFRDSLCRRHSHWRLGSRKKTRSWRRLDAVPRQGRVNWVLQLRPGTYLQFGMNLADAKKSRWDDRIRFEGRLQTAGAYRDSEWRPRWRLLGNQSGSTGKRRCHLSYISRLCTRLVRSSLTYYTLADRPHVRPLVLIHKSQRLPFFCCSFEVLSILFERLFAGFQLVIDIGYPTRSVGRLCDKSFLMFRTIGPFKVAVLK
jgi:hypothetical protein